MDVSQLPQGVADHRSAPIYAQADVTPRPYGRLVMATTSSLHRGIYDVVEVARLIGSTPETVGRWTTTGRDGKAPLVEPSLGWAFSFLDLISLRVVVTLRRRGVKLDEIRNGIRYLSKQLKTDRPLAHEELATVGDSWFANIAAARAESDPDWVNAGKSGQGAFFAIIEPAIDRIEYDHSMASRWRPAERVSIDPEVQTGAPCIDGTRIPTATVIELVRKGGDDPEDVAFDLEIDIEDVNAALVFEDALAA